MGDRSFAVRPVGEASTDQSVLDIMKALSQYEMALRAIRDMPLPEQDNMISANMRAVAKMALEGDSPG